MKDITDTCNQFVHSAMILKVKLFTLLQKKVKVFGRIGGVIDTGRDGLWGKRNTLVPLLPSGTYKRGNRSGSGSWNFFGCVPRKMQEAAQPGGMICVHLTSCTCILEHYHITCQFCMFQVLLNRSLPGRWCVCHIYAGQWVFFWRNSKNLYVFTSFYVGSGDLHWLDIYPRSKSSRVPVPLGENFSPFLWGYRGRTLWSPKKCL